MIKKEEKAKVLEYAKSKEERILISNTIDKINQFELCPVLFNTNFLDLNEIHLVEGLLQRFHVPYILYEVNPYAEKKMLFLVPDYLDSSLISFSDYISCIKIYGNDKLKHKDYMGSIYALGLKRDVVGDIFVQNNVAYAFCLNHITEYLTQNLWKVANQKVVTEKIEICQPEIQNLKVNLKERTVITSSMRIDTILNNIYHMGRAEVKKKIGTGDVFVNAREIFSASILLEKGDIISCRKFGKFMIEEQSERTKNNNIVLKILIYQS